MIQKTKVLTLIVFGLLFLNLSAQEGSFDDDPVASSSDDRKFRLGLQVSPTLSWLKPNTSGYEKEGTKFSLTYGLATEFFLTKNYLFSTGFFLASLGGDLSYQGVYVDNNGVNVPSAVEESYNIKYIEIPLTLKLRTNQIGYMTYYGQFGMKLGVKYKSSSDFSYLEINNKPKIEDVNTSSSLFFMNAYLVLGAGVEYNISGNTNIMLGITYNNGFINQLDTKVNVLDANSNAIIDGSGEPVLSEKDASANLNYVALNIGIFF